jgi:uncharacterized protein (DUF58 family)
MKHIAYLSRHNDVILAKVFDPMEREIPQATLIVGDRSRQSVLNGKKGAIGKSFREGFDDEYATFEAEMKKLRIPVFQINTASDIDVQLKEILKRPGR